MTKDKTKDEGSATIEDFTSWRLQKFINDSVDVAEMLEYCEILFGYEDGEWGVDWVEGRPIPTGTDTEFWSEQSEPEPE